MHPGSGADEQHASEDTGPLRSPSVEHSQAGPLEDKACLASRSTLETPGHGGSSRSPSRTVADGHGRGGASRSPSRSVGDGDLKRINMELRRCAQTTKDVAPELLAIDLKVWELQREHMRLVRIHEEQRAGKVLLELDEQVRREQKELAQTRAEEQQLQESIEHMKLLIQELQDKRGFLLRSLDLARSAEVQAAQEAKSLASEVEETKLSLQAAEQAQSAAKQVLEERVVMRDQSSDKLAHLQAELERVRAATARVREEVRAARAEYRGWQRDKEAAAAYTAQAMGLLATEAEQG